MNFLPQARRSNQHPCLMQKLHNFTSELRDCEFQQMRGRYLLASLFYLLFGVYKFCLTVNSLASPIWSCTEMNWSADLTHLWVLTGALTTQGPRSWYVFMAHLSVFDAFRTVKHITLNKVSHPQCSSSFQVWLFMGTCRECLVSRNVFAEAGSPAQRHGVCVSTSLAATAPAPSAPALLLCCREPGRIWKMGCNCRTLGGCKWKVPHQYWGMVPWEIYFVFNGVMILSHNVLTTLKPAKLHRYLITR